VAEEEQTKDFNSNNLCMRSASGNNAIYRQLLEEILRVADSQGGRLRALLLAGYGFHQLAAVLGLPEANVINEQSTARFTGDLALPRCLLLYSGKIRMLLRAFAPTVTTFGGSVAERFTLFVSYSAETHDLVSATVNRCPCRNRAKP